MHISAVTELENRLLPSLEHLRKALAQKSDEFSSIIKIGRTRRDATPVARSSNSLGEYESPGRRFY